MRCFGRPEERLAAGQQLASGTTPAAWAPAVDISERKDAYLVAVELPGMKADDLEITFEDGLLTIQGSGASRTTPPRRRCTGPSVTTAPSALDHPAHHVEADKIEASSRTACCRSWYPKRGRTGQANPGARRPGHTVLTQA